MRAWTVVLALVCGLALIGCGEGELRVREYGASGPVVIALHGGSPAPG